MSLQAPVATTPATAGAGKPPVQTVVLELAIYQRYMRAGVLYTKQDPNGRDQHYTFTIQQAQTLLTEVDDVDGRPIWRRPRPKKTLAEQQIDLSKPAVRPVQLAPIIPLEQDDTAALGRADRLDDGADEELNDILGLPPEGQTVQV
jgi:hypothetical protein